MRLLVYIAGPYRAKTPFAVEGNIRAARELGAVVVACGHYPVIPHSNTSHFDGLGPDELFLEGTMLLMERCDAVLFAPTWQSSDGAVEEHARAQQLRIPIIYGPDESYTDVARHEEIQGRLLHIVQTKQSWLGHAATVNAEIQHGSKAVLECLHATIHDEHVGEDYFIRRCTVCKKELARF